MPNTKFATYQSIYRPDHYVAAGNPLLADQKAKELGKEIEDLYDDKERVLIASGVREKQLGLINRMIDALKKAIAKDKSEYYSFSPGDGRTYTSTADNARVYRETIELIEKKVKKEGLAREYKDWDLWCCDLDSIAKDIKEKIKSDESVLNFDKHNLVHNGQYYIWVSEPQRCQEHINAANLRACLGKLLAEWDDLKLDDYTKPFVDSMHTKRKLRDALIKKSPKLTEVLALNAAVTHALDTIANFLQSEQEFKELIEKLKLEINGDKSLAYLLKEKNEQWAGEIKQFIENNLPEKIRGFIENDADASSEAEDFRKYLALFNDILSAHTYNLTGLGVWPEKELHDWLTKHLLLENEKKPLLFFSSPKSEDNYWPAISAIKDALLGNQNDLLSHIKFIKSHQALNGYLGDFIEAKNHVAMVEGGESISTVENFLSALVQRAKQELVHAGVSQTSSMELS